MLQDLIAQMTIALAAFLIPPTEPVRTDICTGYELVSRAAGWEIEQNERIGYIMWRESRCQTDAHNPTDPHGGSYGLMQINGFWCKPNKYNPSGWLQAQGLLQTCTDLYNPLINLTAAKAIYDYGIERGNCPWGPWTTRNTKWCR